MKKRSSNPIGLYTIGIVGLFLAGFFLLVIFGAQSYQGTVMSQDNNRNDRAVLAYITTSVKDNDARGAVTIGEDSSGDVLQIADGDTGYSLRIYLRGSDLVEDFNKTGSTLDPDNAEVIGPCGEFDCEMIKDDLLKVSTDRGQVLIKLRSEERSGE